MEKKKRTFLLYLGEKYNLWKWAEGQKYHILGKYSPQHSVEGSKVALLPPRVCKLVYSNQVRKQLISSVVNYCDLMEN